MECDWRTRKDSRIDGASVCVCVCIYICVCVYVRTRVPYFEADYIRVAMSYHYSAITSFRELFDCLRIYRVIQQELPPLMELISEDILSKKCHINPGPIHNIYRVTLVIGFFFNFNFNFKYKIASP
jgi:hypothetical protein